MQNESEFYHALCMSNNGQFVIVLQKGHGMWESNHGVYVFKFLLFRKEEEKRDRLRGGANLARF